MSTHHRHPHPKPMDLELTIISAKHLKNVNWRNGHLTPYVIFYLDQNQTQTQNPPYVTRSDDSNNTKPVWNERFVIPVPPGPNQALHLEVYHSNPNATNRPLVGSLRVPLDDIVEDDIRSFDLLRPSGRPNGKIRLKMSMRHRVENIYQNPPQPAYYYQNNPPANYPRYPPYNASPSVPPPSPAPASSQSSYNYRSCSDSYPGYYLGGYYPPPPPQIPHRPSQFAASFVGDASRDHVELPSSLIPSRPSQFAASFGGGAPVDHVKLPPPPTPHMPRVVDGYGGGVGGGVGGGPSAPVDYAQYDQKQKSGKVGLGVGGVIGGMSGLSIDEGSRYEEEKVVESEVNVREMDDYTDYRRRVDY